jgi:hypothetical protein
MNRFLGADSAPQSAKANRERLFAERPTILDEEAKKTNAVRANMARLRELRLAKRRRFGRKSHPPTNLQKQNRKDDRPPQLAASFIGPMSKPAWEKCLASVADRSGSRTH